MGKELVASESAASQSLEIERKRATFTDTYPNGVQLSADVQQLMNQSKDHRQALTFDEVTLEDKPSDFHPK